MPTFKHIPSGKRFFFAHIPRTAGRFVEANFLKLNNMSWDDVHLDNGNGIMSVVHGLEIAHYHKEHYEKYLDVKNIPHFSIVRNPITRFISGSLYLKRVYGDDIQELMEDPMMFSSMIQNMPFEEKDSWYRPQSEFMTDNTRVWKFENGISKNFFSWLSDIVDIDLKYDDNVDYPVENDEYDKSTRLKPTPKLIKNLKKIYKKDFELFYPDE